MSRYNLVASVVEVRELAIGFSVIAFSFLIDRTDTTND